MTAHPAGSGECHRLSHTIHGDLLLPRRTDWLCGGCRSRRVRVVSLRFPAAVAAAAVDEALFPCGKWTSKLDGGGGSGGGGGGLGGEMNGCSITHSSQAGGDKAGGPSPPSLPPFLASEVVVIVNLYLCESPIAFAQPNCR